LLGLGLLIWLAYRGWSVLLLTPLAAMLAARGVSVVMVWIVGALIALAGVIMLGTVFGAF